MEYPFGSEAPIAYFYPCSGSSACNRTTGTSIKNLKCVNDVVGTVPCDMNLMAIDGYYICNIGIDKMHMPGGEYLNLEIKCPASVKLQ